MENLHWADYLVFALFLIISVGIGVYHAVTGGRQRTVAEFIMANRSLKVLPASLSLSMSIVSSTTLLVFSGESYLFGSLVVLWVAISFAVAVLIIQQLVVVWLYPMKLTSVFEYFERRFKSKAARGTAACFGIIGAVALMGVTLFATSTALLTVTGIPIRASIPVMACICTIYTAIGGIKAVVWTDVFQGVVMFIGVIAVLIKINLLIDPSTSHKIQHDLGRLVWSDWSFDPRVRHTSWGILFGVTLFYIFVFGLNQAAVQRHSATSTIREARLTVLLTLPFVSAVMIISSVSGLNIFSYYVSVNCDPLASRSIRSASQVLPYFVRKTFSENKGFPGFLLSVFCSGALSTLSSSQSGCAANLWEDVFKARIGSRITELKATFFNKFLVVLVGLLGMTIGLLCSVTSGDLVQLIVSFTSVCSAPLVGMFILGGVSRNATWQGAVIGAWTSFAFVMWILIGSFVNNAKSIVVPLPLGPIEGCLASNTSFTSGHESNSTGLTSNSSVTRSPVNNLYMLSFMWYTPIGILITCTLGILVSYIARYVDNSLERMEIDEMCLIQLNRVFAMKWDPSDNAKMNSFCYKTKSKDTAIGLAEEGSLMCSNH